MSIIRSKDIGEQLKKKFEKEIKLYNKYVDDIGTEWKNNIVKISSLPVMNIEFLALTYVYNYLYYEYNIFNPSITTDEKEELVRKIITTPINETIVMKLINDILPQLSQKKREKNPFYRIEKNDEEKKKVLAHIAIYSYIIVLSL